VCIRKHRPFKGKILFQPIQIINVKKYRCKLIYSTNCGFHCANFHVNLLNSCGHLLFLILFKSHEKFKKIKSKIQFTLWCKVCLPTCQFLTELTHDLMTFYEECLHKISCKSNKHFSHWHYVSNRRIDLVSTQACFYISQRGPKKLFANG